MLSMVLAAALAASAVDDVHPYTVDAMWIAAHPELDEKTAVAAVGELARECLAQRERCASFDVIGKGVDRAKLDRLETWLRVLGEVGSDASLPLLLKVSARGVYEADSAAER